MLKRFSREDNPELCGRVLILLSNLLPLSERSGVNLPGICDNENTTEYDHDVKEGTTDNEGSPIDPELYESLWCAQNLFSSPQSVLEGDKWFTFQRSIKKASRFSSCCIHCSCTNCLPCACVCFNRCWSPLPRLVLVTMWTCLPRCSTATR